MKFAEAPARGGIHKVLIFALLSIATAAPATAAENPFVAGMRAMIDAMGPEDEASPFPDDDSFSGMTGTSPFDSLSWSGMSTMPGLGFSPWSGMMPGMGASPWSGMVPGMGTSPWSGMVPGMSTMPGMPGKMSPWDYARPDQWSQFMPRNARPQSRGSDPNSSTREIDGIWEGPNGEKLWFRNGWVRVYRDVHSDARALTRGRQLFIGIPETKDVMQFEYGRRGNYLGLRDGSGNVQIFRRKR